MSLSVLMPPWEVFLDDGRGGLVTLKVEIGEGEETQVHRSQSKDRECESTMTHLSV